MVNILPKGQGGGSRRHPPFSIITPMNNHEKFLGVYIQRVLTQTYPYWEQRTIGDGSTDRTEEEVSQISQE